MVISVTRCTLNLANTLNNNKTKLNLHIKLGYDVALKSCFDLPSHCLQIRYVVSNEQFRFLATTNMN